MFFLSPKPAIASISQRPCWCSLSDQNAPLPLSRFPASGNLKSLEEELNQIPPVGFSLLLTWKDYVDDIFFHRSAHLLCVQPSSREVVLFRGPKTDKNPQRSISFSLSRSFFYLIACTLYAVKYENYFGQDSSYCDKMLTPSSVSVNDRPFVN